MQLYVCHLLQDMPADAVSASWACTGVVGKRVVQLRQLDNDVEYWCDCPGPGEVEQQDVVVLRDYLQLDHSLEAGGGLGLVRKEMSASVGSTNTCRAAGCCAR